MIGTALTPLQVYARPTKHSATISLPRVILLALARLATGDFGRNTAPDGVAAHRGAIIMKPYLAGILQRLGTKWTLWAPLW